MASFYEKDGKLKADLKADETQPQPNYKGIPVVIEKGTDLVALTKLDSTTQQNRIELKCSNSRQLRYLTICKGELSGGMKKGEKEKEKEMEKGKPQTEEELLRNVATNMAPQEQYEWGKKMYEAFRKNPTNDWERKKAICLLNLAAEQGHEESKKMLIEIEVEKQNKLNLVKELLIQQVDVDIIKSTTGISYKEIDKIKKEHNNPRLILSLDGGGIRGILESYTLAFLEEELESEIKAHFKDTDAPAPDIRLGECFDLIAGTSTGGIIALAMRIVDPTTNRPSLKMRNIVDLYDRQGPIIFPSVCFMKGYMGPKFKPENLENIFKNYFKEATLRDLNQPTLITGYDVYQEGLYLFNSTQARRQRSQNFALKDVARATSAAPTYFPAAIIRNDNGETYHFLDGGIAANNPTLYAYEEAKGLYPFASWQVISLGTGSANLFTLSSKRSGGKLHWAGDIPTILMNSCSKIVDDFSLFIQQQRNRYIRLQFDLDQQVYDLDNASFENIERLKGYVRRKIDRKKPDPILLDIKNALLQFYVQRDHYIFYPLVKQARKQAKKYNGKVDLSKFYLQEKCRPYICERALWEVTHAPSYPITCLNLSGNKLSTLSLSYLGKLNTTLKVLKLNNTDLDIVGLNTLKGVNLFLNVFEACENDSLNRTEISILTTATENYATSFFDREILESLLSYYNQLGDQYYQSKNYSEAKKWYQKAVDHGNVYAQEKLAKLSNSSWPTIPISLPNRFRLWTSGNK